MRRNQPVLKRRRFFQGKSVRDGHQGHHLVRPDGSEMSAEMEQDARTLGVRLDGSQIDETDSRGNPIVGDTLFLLFSASEQTVRFALPSRTPTQRWERLLDTSTCAGPGESRATPPTTNSRRVPLCRVQTRRANDQRRCHVSSPLAMSVPAPQPLWYKDAVIYQLHVKTFADSNADGIGDFAGLSSKLDYLADLGVTCLWLPPMYPSPFRDDGYDIADYYSIHPSYGTLDDFREFLDAAHASSACGHRAGAQPHLRPACVVQGSTEFTRQPRRDWCVERHRRSLPRCPHHLRRYRALELGVGP